jgi:anhydro-N-acetylmuramic acid kinase
MRESLGESCDMDGAVAARGTVDEARLAAMLRKDWFAAKPPKSLDRHDFSLENARDLSCDDGAATLTAFTAEAVRIALGHVPKQPTRLMVTGGGRRNPTLMRMIAERTGVPVESVDTEGWNGDAMEAEGFAYLAVRALDGKPLSWPGTTGAPQPMPGGRVHRA